MGKDLDDAASNVETLNGSSDKMREYNKIAGENLKE